VFEPRTASDLRHRLDLKYIGGVERLDLWAVFDTPDDVIKVMPLVRIHVVGGNMSDWDVFNLPLLNNNEVNNEIHGKWGDVILTLEEVNLVETYLRCFAPWVLGKGLTDE
jgi:hypothetical protein